MLDSKERQKAKSKEKTSVIKKEEKTMMYTNETRTNATVDNGIEVVKEEKNMNTTITTNGNIDNVASVNKLTNIQRWKLLISKVQELTANNNRLGVTVQEKKKKICVRVYTDDSRTKFYNIYEIIFKSRFNSYEIFAREKEYIPNALKDNFYKFHIDYDMKHESVITEYDFHSLGLLLTVAHGATRATATKAQ